MKNWQRYLLGGIVGMIGEYLFRVNFNVPALIVLIVVVLVSLIDIIKSR
jgi:hypothetical protein